MKQVYRQKELKVRGRRRQLVFPDSDSVTCAIVPLPNWRKVASDQPIISLAEDLDRPRI